MLGKIKQFFSGLAGKSAGAALPPIVEPKVPNRPQSQPSASKRTATTKGDQRLAETDRRTANLDLLSLRSGTSTKATIRDLSKVSPDLSASVWAYQRLVVTKGFRAVGRNQDGTINQEATNLVQQLLARFNFLTDYSAGFSGTASVYSVAESLTRELRLYGSCSLELVLDKARLPSRLQPISTTQLIFHDDGSGSIYPVQKSPAGEIPLDIPTFFYESMDQDLLTAYSDSPMEAALQAVLADTEFTNDVRRVIKRALHPRLDVSIDYDKFRKTIPPALLGDDTGLKAYQDNYISQVEETVNGLEPDDALVHFDAVEFDYLNNGNVTLNKEYETIQSMTDAKMATGAKVPPSILGHGSGSQNVASSETLNFLKSAEGVQSKVNSILSRALTLGVRLFGVDAYVQFQFDDIELRPYSETAAFRAMEQSIILERLSIGLLSDEEASIALTGRLPPKGYTPLSGTFFKAGATDPNAADTASAQSSTGALQQTLTSDAPKAPKGSPVQRVK